VRSPIVYATLILVAVLIPVFLLAGLTGAFFRPLALSYTLAIAASMVVALTVTPALSLLLLRGVPIERRKSPLVTWLQRAYTAALSRIIIRPVAVYAVFAAVTILGDWLVRRRVPAALVPLYASSTAALSALLEGRAHFAGLHLRDPVSGEYNLAFAREALGRRRAVAVNFARWELGLAVPAGNPSGFRGFADLARPRVRIVNRPQGAGARAALDDAIAGLGLNAQTVRGYEREVAGHLDVAAAIAAGQADLGVTIRLAAKAYGLDFIALREERYDLLVLESHLSTPSVEAVLDALTSSRFSTELGALCAYDTSETGRILARLP